MLLTSVLDSYHTLTITHILLYIMCVVVITRLCAFCLIFMSVDFNPRSTIYTQQRLHSTRQRTFTGSVVPYSVRSYLCSHPCNLSHLSHQPQCRTKTAQATKNRISPSTSRNNSPNSSGRSPIKRHPTKVNPRPAHLRAPGKVRYERTSHVE